MRKRLSMQPSPDHRPEMTTDPINAARDERTVNPRLSSASNCVARRPQHQRPSHHAHQQTQSANCFMRLGLNHRQDTPWDVATRKTPCDRRPTCPTPPHRPSCVRGLSGPGAALRWSQGHPALVAGPPPCAEPDLFARTKSVHLVVSAAMMMMILNSGTTTWEYYRPLKMTTPKYRVRQVAHDDAVEGSSMGGP